MVQIHINSVATSSISFYSKIAAMDLRLNVSGRCRASQAGSVQRSSRNSAASSCPSVMFVGSPFPESLSITRSSNLPIRLPLGVIPTEYGFEGQPGMPKLFLGRTVRRGRHQGR